MEDIQAEFKALATPSGGNQEARFSVVSLTNEDYLLGKDSSGAPAILIKSPRRDATADLLAVELENLTISHRLSCRVSFPNGQEQVASYTLIRCRGDSDLYSYFLWVMRGLVSELGTIPSVGGVAKAVTRLVDLFRSLRQPPRKSTQGLWGELLILANAVDIVPAVSAWHSTPQDIYDFNNGLQRVEVKSFNGRRRLHHFSLAQLQPPIGVEVRIASLPVEPTGGGTSIQDLADQISNRLGSRVDLAVHVASIITDTLGASWREAVRLRFDRQVAESRLAFFDATQVPTIKFADVPGEVSGVHFLSDLSGCKAVKSVREKRADDLFGALNA